MSSLIEHGVSFPKEHAELEARVEGILDAVEEMLDFENAGKAVLVIGRTKNAIDTGEIALTVAPHDEIANFLVEQGRPELADGVRRNRDFPGYVVATVVFPVELCTLMAKVPNTLGKA